MKLLSSASRIVLLLMTLTACYLAVRQLTIDPAFKDLVLMVFSFYFGSKTVVPGTTSTTG